MSSWKWLVFGGICAVVVMAISVASIFDRNYDFHEAYGLFAGLVERKTIVDRFTRPRQVTRHNVTEKRGDGYGKFQPTILRYGRLGSGMFEYAALYGLANATNRSAILSRTFADLARFFTLSVPIDNSVKRFEGFHVLNRAESTGMYNVHKMVQTLTNISTNVTLVGYFQYYKFFSHVSTELRKEFTFRSWIVKKVFAFFGRFDLNDTDVVKVGIHIRRTDLATPKRIKDGFGPPKETFFKNAMNYFRKKYKKVHFVVATDDVRWARQHIIGNDVTFMVGNTAVVDLAILASCDHVIISNGTFSWWAGWLCKGTTVRYSDILKPNTMLYKRTGGDNWPPDSAYNHFIAIDG